MTGLWRRLTAAVRRLDAWSGPKTFVSPPAGPHRCYATMYGDGGRHRAACGCVAPEHTEPARHWSPAPDNRIALGPDGRILTLPAPGRYRAFNSFDTPDVFTAPRRWPTKLLLDTSKPRPDRSLTEIGQRVADGLAPWFDRMADTTQLPVVVNSDPTDTYGRADRI